jgi:hypothetical protein
VRTRTLCALVLIALPAAAQWTEFPLTNVPQANGKPNLSAPAPTTRDGRPDLSGVWGVRPDLDRAGNPGQPRHFVNLAADAKAGEVTMLPSALAFVNEQVSTLGRNHPVSRCLPPGVLLSYTAGTPFKIVQTTNLVVMWLNDVRLNTCLDDRSLMSRLSSATTCFFNSVGKADAN